MHENTQKGTRTGKKHGEVNNQLSKASSCPKITEIKPSAINYQLLLTRNNQLSVKLKQDNGFYSVETRNPKQTKQNGI